MLSPSTVYEDFTTVHAHVRTSSSQADVFTQQKRRTYYMYYVYWLVMHAPRAHFQIKHFQIRQGCYFICALQTSVFSRSTVDTVCRLNIKV